MLVLRLAAVVPIAVVALAAQEPAFEVVSIKPNHSQDFRSMRMQVLPGGRLSATNVPVRVLLVDAFDVPMNPSERLTGAPQWTIEERFDIEAKPAEGAVPTGLSDVELHQRMRGLIEKLLVDRFKMQVHRETKEMTVYAVTVAKDGPKMPKATITPDDCTSLPKDAQQCHQFNGGMGRGLHAKAASMTDLAGFIENWTDHPVVDRTGLDGLFAIESEGWTPMRMPPPPVNAVPNAAPRPNGDGDMSDPIRPTLFMVMQKLGLELKQQKAPVDCYVIEHIERPVEN